MSEKLVMALALLLHPVAIHSHPLRIAAELTLCSWRDGPRAGMCFSKSHELLRTEAFIVYLRGRFNKIL